MSTSGTGGVAAELVGQIALASLQAILEAMVLAAAGFYLGKRGLMTKEGSKLISAVSMRVAIPCLMFSSVLPSVDAALVAAVWPMLFLPAVFVGTGALLGRLVVLICRPPAEFEAGTIAAVALGNSTGLPIVLLTVIRNQLGYLMGKPNETINGKTVHHATNPIAFLGVYLLTYPIIQWLAGGLLLMPKPKHDGTLEAPPESPAASAGVQSVSPGGLQTQSSWCRAQTSATNLEGEVEGEVGDRDAFERTASVRQSRGSALLHTEMVGCASSCRGATMSVDGVTACLPGPASSATRRGASPLTRMLTCVADSNRRQRLLEFVTGRILVPPVCGVLCGLFCSVVPPFYFLLCGGRMFERLPADVACPAPGAPLAFLTSGIHAIGQAAVPLNLLLLGNSLSKGPDWEALPLRCNVGIVVAKMVVMPMFGLGFCLLLDRTIGDEGLGWIQLDDPYDFVFFLAAAAVTATPTANTLVLMTELAGGNKAAMSTTIFSQYLVAPVVLTVTITVIVIVLHAYS
jgi:predicted permease